MCMQAQKVKSVLQERTFLCHKVGLERATLSAQKRALKSQVNLTNSEPSYSAFAASKHKNCQKTGKSGISPLNGVMGGLILRKVPADFINYGSS